MKTTLVPAQVTTVEDKIAGSLSLSQLILLCSPIFLGGVIYAIFPPFLHLNLIKTLLFVLLIIVFSLLSIRIKGKILLSWLIVISRYNLRPRYYIYNKNDLHLRRVKPPSDASEEHKKDIEPKKSLPTLPKIPIPQTVKLQSAIADPRSKLSIRASRKGGLSVHITQIK
jgi:hypothetical protein